MSEFERRPFWRTADESGGVWLGFELERETLNQSIKPKLKTHNKQTLYKHDGPTKAMICNTLLKKNIYTDANLQTEHIGDSKPSFFGSLKRLEATQEYQSALCLIVFPPWPHPPPLPVYSFASHDVVFMFSSNKSTRKPPPQIRCYTFAVTVEVRKSSLLSFSFLILMNTVQQN